MCLHLKSSTEWGGARRKVWKVVQDNLWSLHRDVQYVVGRKMVSDRVSRALTSEELASREVYHGIHVFTSLVASQQCRRYQNTWLILACTVSPADHVADGQHDEAVYMAVTPTGVIR